MSNSWAGGGTFDLDALNRMREALRPKIVVAVKILCSHARYAELKKALPDKSPTTPTELLAFSGLRVEPSNQFPYWMRCAPCMGSGEGGDLATYCPTCRGGGEYWVDGMVFMSDDSTRLMMRYRPPRFQPRWPIDIKVPLREIPAQR
jgi:hypothetical protein